MSATVKADATIRPGLADDLAAVAAIEQESFADPWSERSFEELLRSPAAIFLVATLPDSETVFGYVVSIAVGDQAEILNLAVVVPARRHGLGGALLDAAIEAVSARGAREIFLDVRESNKPARGLYESRGFTGLGRRGRYYRNPVEDALVLRRAVE